MCKNTFVVFGVAAASLLAASGPAAADDDYISVSSCPTTVSARTTATSPSLLDTAEARRFLQGLVRSDGRNTSLYVATDPSFVAAAQFPGLLDTLLLGPQAQFAPPAVPGAVPGVVPGAVPGAVPGDVPDVPDVAMEPREILEPLVADAMGCPQAAGSVEAALAEPAPTSLLDRAGATAVLRALANRPEACATTGTTVSSDGRSVTADNATVSADGATVTANGMTVTASASLLDAIGVRRTLDILVGRPSACVTTGATTGVTTGAAPGTVPGASVSVSTDAAMPESILDTLGIGDLIDGLLR